MVPYKPVLSDFLNTYYEKPDPCLPPIYGQVQQASLYFQDIAALDNLTGVLFAYWKLILGNRLGRLPFHYASHGV